MDMGWKTLSRLRRGLAAARSGHSRTPSDAAPRPTAPALDRTAELAFARQDRDRLTAEAEARTAFLLALVRDLRTPLNTVCGFAQLLRLNSRADPLSPRQAQALDEMSRAVAEMAALLDDSAAFADAHRPLAPPLLRRLDLRLAARQACDALESRARAAQVALVCAPPSAGLLARADPERLGLVLRRLIGDAVRHTPPGGTVRIEIDGDGDRLRVVVHEPGGEAARSDIPAGLLDVVDGDGRLSPAMGLAAAQRLAESMGGALQALPRRLPQDGAAFALSLPVAAPRQDADLRGRLILHAGEGRVEAALMRHAAMRMGVHLHVAESPYAALPLALALRPDAVVIDLGRSPAQWLALRSRLEADPAVRGLPVLALTPPTSGPNRRRLRAARFDAWLAKPLDLDALGDALETVLSPARHAAALDAEASDGA